MFTFTHKQIVEIAYKWLLKNGGVGVAFKELKSCADEIPDVIGFDSYQSILIECKVSRSDFLQDKNKPHRAKGMGNWKYFCCPKGLIKKEELPDKWGLIYVDEQGKARIEYDCRKKKINEGWPQEWMKKEYPEGYIRTVTADENKFEADTEEERRIMYTALRRLMLRGFMRHIYEETDSKSHPDVNEVIALNQTLFE
jgi:hypothetical protein